MSDTYMNYAEWRKISHYVYECSHCGYMVMCKTPFCAHCGFKMIEVKEK